VTKVQSLNYLHLVEMAGISHLAHGGSAAEAEMVKWTQVRLKTYTILLVLLNKDLCRTV